MRASGIQSSDPQCGDKKSQRWKSTAVVLPPLTIDADALAALRLVRAGQKRRKRRGSGRLCHDPQDAPEHVLAVYDRVVGDEDDTVNVLPSDRKNPLADAARCQRIRRHAAAFSIDRMSGGERLCQGWTSERLDADDLDAAGVPSGDAGDQPATADRDQHRVDIGRLFIKL